LIVLTKNDTDNCEQAHWMSRNPSFNRVIWRKEG